MQKTLKTIVTLTFIAFAVLVPVIRTNGGYNAVSRNYRQPRSTRELFLHNCARCHGADGLGQTALGKKYDVPDLTIEGKNTSNTKIRRVIVHGKSDMPAFGKKLTARQIANLAAYVKKL